MSEDQMQDADLPYIIQLSQQDATSPALDATTQTPEPALPDYANPSFYLTQQPQAAHTPAPEPNPFGSQRSNKLTSSPHPKRARSRRSSPYWRMVGQLPRQYWRVLTRPGVVTFYIEEGNATWSSVWTQVLGFAALNALIIIGTMLVINFIEQQSMQHLSTFHPPAWAFLLDSLILGVPIGVISALFTILGYFFNAAAVYFFARLFGGLATFLEHCYCTALIVVPAWVISVVLSSTLFHIPPFPPLLASTIGMAGFIYGGILQVFMIVAIHRLNWPRAVAVVIIATIILSSGILPFVPIPQQ